MVKSKSDYNTWHQHHSQDDDVTASWHVFVQEKLQRQDVDKKNILEIGCGRGGFSNYLANLPRSPKKVFACDFSNSALEIAQKKYPHEIISWQKENIMSLSFRDELFDTAISCETIEHITNPKKAIRELYRVIKPGGKLLLTCPNYFNAFGIWCIYRWMIGKPYTEGGQPYVNYILMPVVYFWIKKSGFKILNFSSSELIIPARVPKHYYNNGTPWWLRIFGHRTFYVLVK